MNSVCNTTIRWVSAGVLLALGIPAAQAGVFGALDDLANAAQDSGINVPGSVYEAGNAVQDMRNAGQQVTPTATQIASPPVCPPGYTCAPQTPPPVCPPGDICRPDAPGTIATPAPTGRVTTNSPIAAQNALLQSQLGFTILPRERVHRGDPHYIQFVFPSQSFVNAHDPHIESMGDPGHYRQFEVSQNNRELPYLSPADWQRYIVETYRVWPRQEQIPTDTVAPGDTRGGLYRIGEGDYRFFTQTAVSFFLGSAQGESRIAQERAQGIRVPNLWVILDPDCTLSYDFYQQAKKDADQGRIDIHAVVVGLDPGSPGRAEAILASRAPGVKGAGAGQMAATELAQDYDHFSFNPEQGGVAPLTGNAAARSLVRKNDRLMYAVAATYSRQGNSTQLMAYPTMLFRDQGQAYLYTNLHSQPIWYTKLLSALAQGAA